MMLKDGNGKIFFSLEILWIGWKVFFHRLSNNICEKLLLKIRMDSRKSQVEILGFFLSPQSNIFCILKFINISRWHLYTTQKINAFCFKPMLQCLCRKAKKQVDLPLWTEKAEFVTRLDWTWFSPQSIRDEKTKRTLIVQSSFYLLLAEMERFELSRRLPGLHP